MVRKKVVKNLKGEKTAGYEYRFIRKNKEIMWVLEMVTPIEYKGERAGLGSFMDITERKKIEETMHQSEDRYRTILDEMADAYFEVDIAGNYTFVNDSCCSHLGYSKEELIGTSFRGQMAKEEFDKVYKAFGNIYITGKPERGIFYKLIRKDGTTAFAELAGFPLQNPKGEVIGFRGVGRDITERRQMEEALRQSEEKYRTIIENIQDGYFEVDLAGKFTFFNESLCEIYGYPKEELLDMNNRQYADKENAKKVFDAFNEIYKTGITGSIFEYEIIRKDGTRRQIEVSASLKKNSSGKPIGFRGISRDITERKRAEEQLQQTLESLRKSVGATIQVMVSAVEMRDPYTAGHQIRTADLARIIATEMGLPKEKIDGIRMAGSIHDIGKISIPAEILTKPTKLTDIEFSLIKEHSHSGYEMLKDVESPWPLAQIVYQHHERMDGSGYPRNLKGNEILIEARIMAVADVVEAMASHRPYRPGLGIDAALAEIEKNKGTIYDNTVANACLKLFREKGYQFK
jgi:PAS domain S-box-containing protein